MKTLIWKELRENFKLGVFSFLVMLAVVVGTQLYYLDMIEAVQSGSAHVNDYIHRLQPLTSGNFRLLCVMACCISGLGLGWVQIRAERHRDLWAFLVHRPVSRTRIFWSKVVAGMILYLVALGSPLLYFVGWELAPGNVAAPFDWQMINFLGVALLAGIGWYFAGMLTSIRQTRWFGSRALGVGTALAATVLIFVPDHLELIAAFFIAALGAAVWGAFQTNGIFRSQPVAGKIGLTLTLAMGCGVIVTAGFVLAVEMTASLREQQVWSEYHMGNDGNIYLKRWHGQGAKVFTLDGKPVDDPDGEPRIANSMFNHEQFAPSIQVSTVQYNLDQFGQPNPSYFATPTRDAIWFVVRRTGRLEAFDIHTRKFMGSLGPDGWSNSHAGNGIRFLFDSYPQQFLKLDRRDQIIIATKDEMYLADLDSHTVKSVWSPEIGDTIKAYSHYVANGKSLVLTQKKAVLLHIWDQPEKPFFELPFKTPAISPTRVIVHNLSHEAGASFCVWMDDYKGAGEQAIWISTNGTITKEISLPEIKDPVRRFDSVMDAFAPSVLFLTKSIKYHEAPIRWRKVGISALVGLPGMLIGLWLGWRYNYSAKRQLVWAAFNVLFGIPGFLAFLGVQEWPAREHCASCGKLRVVDGDHCEHCSAGFEAPKRNGTEIFKVLEMV